MRPADAVECQLRFDGFLGPLSALATSFNFVAVEASHSNAHADSR